MTNILIIEDEVPAANYLKGLLQQMDPQANVLECWKV